MAIYSLNYIGTTANRIYFNDYNFNYQTDGVVYRVKSRRPQARELRDYDIPITEESGISDFTTLIGKMGYVIEGTMYPNDETSSAIGLRNLRKLASLDVEQADNNSDGGYVPYNFDGYNLNVKVLYVDVTENTNTGLVYDFRLVCKIKDPTLYGETTKTVSTAAADFTTASGTAIFPVTLPIIFGASTSSVSASSTNNGDVPVYPNSITIYGPVNRPKWTNTTTGEYIEVDTNLATASNVLRITYDKDTLSVETDGNSVIGSVTSGSTYFKIPTGTSNFTLTGSSISNGSYAVMTFNDGYALS